MARPRAVMAARERQSQMGLTSGDANVGMAVLEVVRGHRRVRVEEIAVLKRRRRCGPADVGPASMKSAPHANGWTARF